MTAFRVQVHAITKAPPGHQPHRVMSLLLQQAGQTPCITCNYPNQQTIICVQVCCDCYIRRSRQQVMVEVVTGNTLSNNNSSRISTQNTESKCPERRVTRKTCWLTPVPKACLFHFQDLGIWWPPTGICQNEQAKAKKCRNEVRSRITPQCA